MKTILAHFVLAFIVILLLSTVLIAYSQELQQAKPHLVLMQPQTTPPTLSVVEHEKVLIVSVLAADLDIMSDKDAAQFFLQHNRRPWSFQQQVQYGSLLTHLDGAYQVRETLIAQYNSLTENPTTKNERPACLPPSLDTATDIQREIAALNSYCIPFQQQEN